MAHIDFHHSTLITYLLLYLAGLTTSLTPCVYPMIPIVVGYLGNVSGSASRRFQAALGYVVGLSTVYSLLGLAAAMTGRMFGELTTNSWLYLAIALLILVLGGSMMEWYTLPIPRFLQGRADTAGGTVSIGKAFVVGASSGLIASPCTAPVLAGLLIFIAAERKYAQGALMMMTFSLGMNTLLLVIGFSASLLTSIPRSGRWMVGIKRAMALILLGAGLYLVYRAGQLS